MSINSDDVASALTRTPLETMRRLIFAASSESWVNILADYDMSELLAAHGWSLDTYANACRRRT